MNKITKVWFDENLGDIQRQEIPYDSIFVPSEKVDADRGTRETTMHLTREELAERFGVDIKANAPAMPEIWYGDHLNLNADYNTVNYAGPQVKQTGLLAAIERIKEDMLKPCVPEPYYLTADLYDRMHAEGMALGGVTRLDPPPRYSVRPPDSGAKRAALHPLVARLIDNLNKEN